MLRMRPWRQQSNCRVALLLLVAGGANFFFVRAAVVKVRVSGLLIDSDDSLKFLSCSPQIAQNGRNHSDIVARD